ncbi:hypothetical protein HK101_003984 [Irineochytrium annulatum]|nr:hypothetical protein HK101_003984 [Irineochytrium annulatum]
MRFIELKIMSSTLRLPDGFPITALSSRGDLDKLNLVGARKTIRMLNFGSVSKNDMKLLQEFTGLRFLSLEILGNKCLNLWLDALPGLANLHEVVANIESARSERFNSLERGMEAVLKLLPRLDVLSLSSKHSEGLLQLALTPKFKSLSLCGVKFVVQSELLAASGLPLLEVLEVSSITGADLVGFGWLKSRIHDITFAPRLQLCEFDFL